MRKSSVGKESGLEPNIPLLLDVPQFRGWLQLRVI